jgi:hypothetical protein
MVRPAHHPEQSRRTNTKFKFSNFQNNQGFRLGEVSNFDLPANAYQCFRGRAAYVDNSGYFNIRMLFKAWQAGIRISDF